MLSRIVLSVSLLLLVLGCSTNPSLAGLDAGLAADAASMVDAHGPDVVADATPLDAGEEMILSSDAQVDAAPLPDANLADAAPLCHHATRGALLGDSIVSNLYNNARNLLQVQGDTVIRLAVAGSTVLDQYNAWLTSTARGNPAIDWIYLQCGINDILHGDKTAAVIVQQMTVFLDDIYAHNPNAVVFFGAMDPARTKLDAIAANRYPLWQQVQAGYAALGARFDISDALNDGTDRLIPIDDYGDGLHPSPTGDRTSATILRSWVVAAFPDVTCAP
jgi:lysophospholipase L1-like esterase